MSTKNAATAWVDTTHYACRGGLLAKEFALSIADRSVGQIAGADVFGTRADELVIAVLFEDVARPAGDAADGEDRREKVERDVHHVIG